MDNLPASETTDDCDLFDVPVPDRLCLWLILSEYGNKLGTNTAVLGSGIATVPQTKDLIWQSQKYTHNVKMLNKPHGLHGWF